MKSSSTLDVHTANGEKKGERRKRRTAKATANDSTQNSYGGLVYTRYTRMNLSFLLHILVVTSLTMAGLVQPL